MTCMSLLFEYVDNPSGLSDKYSGYPDGMWSSDIIPASLICVVTVHADTFVYS